MESILRFEFWFLLSLLIKALCSALQLKWELTGAATACCQLHSNPHPNDHIFLVEWKRKSRQLRCLWTSLSFIVQSQICAFRKTLYINDKSLILSTIFYWLLPFYFFTCKDQTTIFQFRQTFQPKSATVYTNFIFWAWLHVLQGADPTAIFCFVTFSKLILTIKSWVTSSTIC